ncbi:MAG: aminomethyl-transferring glycine dehydrogenase [Deltaproteobacteria bacterium HGW-Deltaproteobacteria-19]|nr:MAG: aminomethyl-transferring glycine dehydrogenase [Deltaproteobacteria bacterium HGW-Deltaproteobacteria-19]
MEYVPHTERDKRRMLETIGVASVEDLFSDIPESFRLKGSLNLPPPLAEQEAFSLLEELAARNRPGRIVLAGAGAYRHYIPAVVGHVTGRSEFYTAYTPYQAEISQGILQAIYEYQTMIANLTGMQVANASMYDGASAVAEAAVLAAKTLGRNRIVTARSVHPEYRRVLSTYAWANGYDLAEVPFGADGRVDGKALQGAMDGRTAAVILQSPNFFGVIEDLSSLEETVHSAGAFLVAAFTEALSLGILKPPGASGADIVAGEGQSFGNPMAYGGPYLGIFAATGKLLRKIPGRLAGATVDRDGNRAFVLTLQTREQHIRRERATSNICSNEALCALAASVYLVSLGKNLKKLAELNVWKALYLKDRLLSLPGWKRVFSGPEFNEFVLRCPDSRGANALLEKEGIIGGCELGHEYPELEGCLLFCATEMLSRIDMDRVVEILTGA